MAKLFELLAVEGDLEGIYNQILGETKTNFTKLKDRYFGQRQVYEPTEEGGEKEADVHKEMDDTVRNKLDYTAGHVIKYLDCVLQKERTNQDARADIVIDGVVIATQVPATFLLGLEKKLKKIRDEIYRVIPTLQPGVKWVPYDQMGKDVVQKEHPDERYRTKKVKVNRVLYEATTEHPAQVETDTEDIRIGRILTYTWCSMLSSAEKSAMMNRVDKLYQAVKVARSKANEAEVVDTKIGKQLFDYIHNVKSK